MPVRLRWKWPADLEKEKLVLFTSFTQKWFKLQDLLWALANGRPPDPSQTARDMGRWQRLWGVTRSALCGPGISIASVSPEKQPLLWTLTGREHGRPMADFVSSELREIKEQAETPQWEEGTYVLADVLVLRPNESDVANPGIRRFDVIAAARTGPHESKQVLQGAGQPSL